MIVCVTKQRIIRKHFGYALGKTQSVKKHCCKIKCNFIASIKKLPGAVSVEVPNN